MKNKILLTITVSAVLLLGGFLFWQESYLGEDFSKEAEANSADNVTGWAWSDTIGWVSFNCTDGGPTRNNICGTSIYGTSNYGVNIDANTGKLSGYAWSDNIGWISFNESELNNCPSGSCFAKVDSDTGAVTGWAKAVNYSIDDSYGWIHLNHGKANEVSINTTTGNFSGYGWGGGPTDEAVIGWLLFDTAFPVKVDPIVFNKPPYTKKRDVTSPIPGDFCDNNASYVLSWVFRDDNAPHAYEQSFEMKITNSNNGNSNIYSESYGPNIIKDGDTQTVNLNVSTSENLTANPPVVKYGESYTWQVRVQDDYGAWSTWEAGPSINNVPEDYPTCSFSITPAKPNISEKIQFTDTSSPGAYAITNWSWDFGNGDTSLAPSPTYTYYKIGDKTVTLTITDAGGRSCSTSQILKVRPGKPEYDEVIPR